MRSPDKTFWNGQKVFLTGHTGFKGGWLATWLLSMGAEVFGYALSPNTEPRLFDCLWPDGFPNGVFADIRDLAALKAAMTSFQPTVLFHMAAQPLVRLSYAEPIETFHTNVVGTANVLEAARSVASLRAIVSITTDKCYENLEQIWPYREPDRLGGTGRLTDLCLTWPKPLLPTSPASFVGPMACVPGNTCLSRFVDICWRPRRYTGLNKASRNPGISVLTLRAMSLSENWRKYSPGSGGAGQIFKFVPN